MGRDAGDGDERERAGRKRPGRRTIMAGRDPPHRPPRMTAFYHPRRQWIVGDAADGGLTMLPQFGSPSGGTHRPLNSYALVFKSGPGGSGGRKALLFDAPLRHAVPGVRGLTAEGVEVVGCVLSHADLAGSGDAFDVLAGELNLPLFLHPEDRHDPRVRGLMQEWEDPCEPVRSATCRSRFCIGRGTRRVRSCCPRRRSAACC